MLLTILEPISFFDHHAYDQLYIMMLDIIIRIYCEHHVDLNSACMTAIIKAHNIIERKQ